MPAMQQRRNDTGELNFYLLKCLVALVDHAHVSRAADALSISQPTMSRAMAEMRSVTGDPILVKGGAGLIPTAKALQLREFADRILREMDGLLGRAVRFDPEVTRFVFRLVATDYLQSVFIDGFVQRLVSRFPTISLALRHPLPPAQLTRALEAGEVDFCAGMLPPSLQDLRHRLLFRDRVVCVAAHDHPAAGCHLTAAEFAALDHAVITPTVFSFGDTADQALDALGLRRNRRFVMPNYLTVAGAVESSTLVALIPASLAHRLAQRYRIAYIDIPLEIPGYDVYLYWHDRTHLNPAHDWFRAQVVQSLAAQVAG